MNLSLTVLVFCACVSSVVSSGLYCWMCAQGVGTSFKHCDARRTVQNCSEDGFQEPGKGPLNRCAYFSYFSIKEQKRLYAKSCTFASYCTETGDVFCKNVPGGATQCQVQCCEKEKCNADDQFQNPKTWPTPTPTPTDSPWCNWNETNANNAVHGAVCGFWLVVTTCVLTVFSIEVH